MSLIVLINGIEDFTQSDADRNESRKKVFERQFPDAHIEIFDSLSENGGFLGDESMHLKAKAIIHCLQLFVKEQYTEDAYSHPIVFVAHNMGAALVKKILLIALEDKTHQWIAFRTVALCFIESPSASDSSDWEQFLFQLLAVQRLAISNIATLVNILPKTLAYIEKQFSVISHAFHIYNEGPFQLGNGNPWNFQKDESKLSDVFLNIRTVLRKKATCLQKDYQNFMQILSSPDFPINRLNISESYPPSLNWVDKNPSYEAWRGTPKSSILEITGPSGSGKAYIASYIHHSLLIQHPNSEALFLSFDFSRHDIQRNSETSLVLSLIRQILILKPEVYKSAKNLACEQFMLCNRLWTLFRYLITASNYSHIFLILNSVDQCHDNIMKKLNRLATTTSATGPLKILVTGLQSTPEVDAELIFKLSLRNSNWDKAIRCIVNERMSSIIENRLVWKHRKQALVDKICYKESTYIGVMMNLGILEQKKAITTISTLNNLLNTPFFSTKMAFQSIVGDLRQSELAMRAINWIFYAVRPLSTSELAVALAIKSVPSECGAANELTFETLVDNVSWDIMEELGNILGATVRIVDEKITLIHDMFRDYLEHESGILVPDFNSFIIEQCLHYLSIYPSYEADLSIDRLKIPRISVAAAFIEYASLHWMDHYKLEHLSNISLDKKVMEFFTSEQAVKEWEKICTSAFGWTETFPTNILLQATRLHFNRLAQKLLEEDIWTDTNLIQEAAVVAAGTGNAHILGNLLKNTKSLNLQPLLEAAAKGGHVDIINFIIHRMDEDAFEASKSDRSRKAPVLLATSSGKTAAVRALLEQGFSIQALDEHNNTPVHLASQAGDAETLGIIQDLYKSEFDSFMIQHNKQGLCPLQLASRTGSIEAFNLLFNSSPKDKTIQESQKPIGPIQLAAQFGHHRIVEKLFAADAEFSIEHGDCNFFEIAVKEGHDNVVLVLLNEFERRGNNMKTHIQQSTPEIPGLSMNTLRSCLDIAIENGYSQIVQLLIGKTKREKSTDREYMKAAIEAGYLDVAKVLTVAGISPLEWHNTKYNPFLDIAVRENFVDIVHYLVEERLTPQYDGWETSLHYAAYLGHEYCIREMLRTASVQVVQQSDWTSKTALERAASAGHLFAFKELLMWKDGAALPVGIRPAMMLILVLKSSPKSKSTKVDFVNFLLDNQWNPNIADTNGQEIPLQVAVQESSEEIVKLLLDRGANPDAVNDSNKTSLHAALELNYDAAEKIISILLEGGANPNLGDSEGWTALHYIAGRRHTFGHEDGRNIIQNLLHYQAEPNAMTTNHLTPLYIAIQSDNDSIASYLLHDTEADPNLYGGTLHSPLQLAVSKEAKTLVADLLEAKADPNAKGGSFGSALHAAVWKGAPDIVKLLIENNASGGLMAPPFGTPLHVLASTTQVYTSQFKLIATYLCENGVPINAYDYNHRTPLMLALSHWAESEIQALISLGADPSILDNTKATALHHAAQVGSLGVVRELLDAKAEVDAKDGCGRSVLQRAVLGQEKEVFETLLKNLPVEKRKENLENALPASLKIDSRDIFNIIIQEEGINLSTPDKSGWTSLDIANCYELSDVFDMMMKKGATRGVKKEPTEWCAYDRDSIVILSDDNMEAWIEGISNDDFIIEVVGSVRSNHCIATENGIFYFEVEVLEYGKSSIIAIGLLPECSPLGSLVGWKSGSWGYHSDDGSLLTDNQQLQIYPKYGKNQTIGVAVEPSKKRAWFTLDGGRVGDDIENVTGQLYPAVSFQSDQFVSTRVSVNFGKNKDLPFKYPNKGLRNEV